MSSRLQRVGSNPTLTAYIQGAAQQVIAPFQEFIAPTVPVATMAGKLKKWDEKSPLIIPSTRRAMKGEATIVGFDLSDKDYNLAANALDYPVDKLEQDDQGLMNILQEGADITSQLASLASLKETIDKALGAVGAGSDVNINAADVDLVAVIDAKIKLVIKGAKGFAPMMKIRIQWGFDAWTLFKNHKSVKDRFRSGRKESTEITLENVGSLFTVPVEMMTTTAVHDANKNADAADIQFMLDTSLIIFATCQNPTRYDTSFMKTLRKRGQFMSTRFYERADGRVDFAGFDWNEEIVIGNEDAAERINWTQA